MSRTKFCLGLHYVVVFCIQSFNLNGALPTLVGHCSELFILHVSFETNFNYDSIFRKLITDLHDNVFVEGIIPISEFAQDIIPLYSLVLWCVYSQDAVLTDSIT